MRNAYTQVFRAYFRRPFTSLALGNFVFFGLLIPLLETIIAKPHFQSVLLGMTMGALFLNMAFWLMFYEQVVNTRLRLWPNFVGPQLAAFVFLASAVLGLQFLELNRCENSTVAGTIALLSCYLALVGFVMLMQSAVIFCLLLAGYFWMIWGSGSVLVYEIFKGEFPTISLAIIAGSFALIAAVLFRFFHLHEESHGYRVNLGMDGANLKPRMTGEVNRGWANARESEPWAHLIRGRRYRNFIAHSPWTRIQRWRLQNNLVFMMLMLASICGAPILMNWYLGHRKMDSIVQPPPLMFTFMLLMIVPAAWMQRWKYIETESLRPIARNAFFIELGLAMMFDFAAAFLLSAGAMAAIMLLTWRSHPVVFPMVSTTILGAGNYVMMFGFSAWIIRRRSPGLFVLGIFLVMPGMMFSAFTSGPLQDSITMPRVLLATFIFVVIGIVLARRGYRLWLTTELG